MQKILLTIISILCVTQVMSDTKSKSLLENITKKLNSYTSYEVAFSASMEGEFSNVPGRITISGDKFYVSIYDSELFFDGKTRYTLNHNEDEVVIESPDPSDNSILSNPVRFFKLYDSDFNHVYKGEEQFEGRKVEVVELMPKGKNSGYTSIILNIDSTSGLPVGVVYQMDSSASTIINIKKLTPNVPVTAATFTFDRKKYPNVEVIDFR